MKKNILLLILSLDHYSSVTFAKKISAAYGIHFGYISRYNKNQLIYKKNIRFFSTSLVPVSPNKTRAYSTDSNNSNKIEPAVIYANADTQKELIFRDNKGKSGVYR